jgi:DNA helicase-2/ATP-dependent DNA helicase PcrA
MRIVAEERTCLERVLTHLETRTATKPAETVPAQYEQDMLELRDLIANARLEDVPPLLEQMERLQSLAARRRTATTEAYIDPRCPYFGHLVLQEGARRREVLIGRATHVDTDSGIRIVDWRDAPVSKLFYRYEEGDDYDEVFGDRHVEGEVLVRRTVTIAERELKRIVCPQGTFARRGQAHWEQLGTDALKLHGGQGSALRAEAHHRPGKLGGSGAEISEDKHLREITALIDPRQFELITRPDAGLVVIQGGAGSGKTTIGLHRLAYLAFQDKRRFRPDRMLVIVYNDALARYISLVLPALEVSGVAIRTFQDFAAKLRATHFRGLPGEVTEDTPGAVTRLKKHPAMLRAIDAHVARLAARSAQRIQDALSERDGAGAEARQELAQEVVKLWNASAKSPLAHRFHGLDSWLKKAAKRLDVNARVGLERVVTDGLRECRDVVGQWADLLTDRDALVAAFNAHTPDALSPAEWNRASAWCTQRCEQILGEVEAHLERAENAEREEVGSREPARDEAEDEAEANARGVDGRDVEDRVALDREDDALLLRLYQKLRGPLLRGGKVGERGAATKEPLVYEHVLVDEAQDLSPVELAVVLGTVSPAQSITLSGDTAQRLQMDNGFSDWKTVLGELGLAHVEVEPLKLSYRSTREIVGFARAVLGPLAPDEQPVAVRSGAPVDLFSFGHSGDSVAFLGEALRELIQLEPQASVAVIARFPEQADTYYEGLRRAEVPYLRRIARQDFPFKAGIDVTDIRQVKGLEFDYVVLVEVSDAAYPAEDEARHLLHIGATRAAHQLWVLTTGRPSPLLPAELLDRGY